MLQRSALKDDLEILRFAQNCIHQKSYREVSEDTRTIKANWKWGPPEGSRALDRLLDPQLTFCEKLEWLEEAETLSLHLRPSRNRMTTIANAARSEWSVVEDRLSVIDNQSSSNVKGSGENSRS